MELPRPEANVKKILATQARRQVICPVLLWGLSQAEIFFKWKLFIIKVDDFNTFQS